MDKERRENSSNEGREENKFVGTVRTLSFSQGEDAAKGILNFLWKEDTIDSKTPEQKAQYARENWMQAMEDEIEGMKGDSRWKEGYQVCRKWFQYVVKETAKEEHSFRGNAGAFVPKDTGNDGCTLED